MTRNFRMIDALCGVAFAAAGLAAGATGSRAQEPVLAYRTLGNGSENVLVLHHWMGNAGAFEPAMPYLDGEANTYVFADLRGYGASRGIPGRYDAREIAADAFRLADELGWDRFHLVGHSMSGMAVQRMMLDDWTSGARRLKSVSAVTPVIAEGYPADEDTRTFLWNLIHDPELSAQGVGLLTGGKLPGVFTRRAALENIRTSAPAAMRGYYAMWLDQGFADEVRAAKVGTPVQVIGGRRDLPGFQEDVLRGSFEALYTDLRFAFIENSGHFPMEETPALFASLIEAHIAEHR